MADSFETKFPSPEELIANAQKFIEEQAENEKTPIVKPKRSKKSKIVLESPRPDDQGARFIGVRPYTERKND